jgi:hypothetical protein
MKPKQIPADVLRWIWQGVLFLANNPKVRKMLWGWAVDGYKTIKRKRNDKLEKRSSQAG